MELKRHKLGVLEVVRWGMLLLQYLLPLAAVLFALLLGAAFVQGAQLASELAGEPETAADPRGALLAFKVAMLSAIIATGAIWLVVRHLLALLRNVQGGEAFLRGNSRHLRGMGLGLVVFMTAYVASKVVIQWQVPSARGVDWLAVLPGLIAILLMFVLASIFDEGAEMREELEATI